MNMTLIPWYVFWNWPIILAVIGIAMLIWVIRLVNSNVSWKIAAGTVLGGGSFCCLAGLFTCCMEVVSHGGAGTRIRPNGQVVGVVPPGQYYNIFRGDGSRSYNLTKEYAASAHNSVAVLTDGRILRLVRYDFSVEVGHSAEAFSAAITKIGPRALVENDTTLFNLAQDLSYDFNAQYGSQLQSFFNPNRSDQQAAFDRLMHQALAAKLAERGLLLTSVHFDVEDLSLRLQPAGAKSY